MPYKLFKTCEIFMGGLTIASTTFLEEFFWKLIIGVVVYFTSRLLYKNYGKKVDVFFKDLKSNIKVFFKIK